MANLFKISSIFLFCLSLPALPSTSSAEEWKELKGEHFIAYYSRDPDFTQTALQKAEGYYQDIAADLGYQRYSDFWTWDKRAKIYLYPDHEAYLAATGRPTWSEGMADYQNKAIASYTGSPGFLENILPHEIAHLTFRSFVGFKGEIPVCLDEGVAQWWTSGIKNSGIQTETKRLFYRGALVPMNEIIKLDPRIIAPTSTYTTQAHAKNGRWVKLTLTSDELVKTFYLEAASLIGFLRERYGPERFTEFCRALRDGKSLDKALASAYREQLGSASDLEKEWLNYLSL